MLLGLSPRSGLPLISKETLYKKKVISELFHHRSPSLDLSKNLMRNLKEKSGIKRGLLDLSNVFSKALPPGNKGYFQKQPYFGAVVGRVANRIAKGTFMLDGKEYKLAINNGPNSLHGGVRGFDKVLWTPRVLSNGVEFSRVSPDGEEGYPGELKVWVTYTLDGRELVVNYRAQASQATPVNLTNHSYFNLAGQGSPNIYDHEVTIEADAFLPVDETLIPTGEVAPVQGTAFDLRKSVELGKHLQEFHINGFDHNFCLKGSKEKHFCARVHHAGSGRVLEVYTTQPGVQFYTGNFLDGTLKGKSGAVYPKHSGFCLETQNWPDAVNQPHFPPVLLKPGEDYDHTTWFKFSVA